MIFAPLIATRSALNTLPTSDSRPGTVGGHQLENRAVVARVEAEVDLRRRREHAHLARRAARHDQRRVFRLLQNCAEAAFDLADARRDR
jgi:hypothetical protein